MSINQEISMKNIKALLDAQKNEIVQAINTSLSKITSDIAELKIAFTNIKSTVQKNTDDINEIRQQLLNLTSDNKTFSEDIIKLSAALDDQVNRNLRKTQIFKNIPVDTSKSKESWSDTKLIIADTIEKAANIDPKNAHDMIKRCHRRKVNENSTKSSHIFVKFHKWADIEHTKNIFFMSKNNSWVEQMYSPSLTQRRNEAMKERRRLTEIKSIISRYLEYPTILKVKKKREGSRPISLLPNIDKALERLMFNRLYEFFNENKLFFELQFGFRTNYSRSLALLSLTEKIKDSLDEGMFGCGIFIDLQKVFDTVDVYILLYKLSYYGIRGVSNSWFKSFLTNRTQLVSISGVSSDLSNIKVGAPQGSVLGPLVFLIYINDMSKALKFCRVQHFANDTNLLYFNKSIKNQQIC
ncbi:uncharacterized protein LOC136088227 [Hydra vulgaris]|uniref:Uncharacterized protein LOC136088227 n=1 Tax=Hydra vulgaris TaxID=6087 RepID=A0ABM4D174_HYDVU